MDGESSDSDTNDTFSDLQQHQYQNNHTIRLLNINAQSLRYKVDQLTAESTEADIIVLTETWLSPENKDEDLSIPNFYKPIRKDRTWDSHGGVAIYCRQNLNKKHRSDLEIDNLEATWL